MPLSWFELFIAKRYLRARRKEAVISVITAISILGVAAGVMALIIALAVNNGFRETLQRNLLGAMAHVNVEEKIPSEGIVQWPAMTRRIAALPHVTGAAPALYAPIFLTGPLQQKGAFLKGVDVASELRISDALRNLKEGSLDRLRNPDPNDYPGIILGARLSAELGMVVNSVVTVVSPPGELTPFGPRPNLRRFRVAGVFETGFFEIDDMWAYASLPAAQEALSLDNVVNRIEIKIDDLNAAPQVARQIGRAHV